MASSSELGRLFFKAIQSGNHVSVENFLMSSSSKDIAMACTLLNEDECAYIFKKVSKPKQKDIADYIRYYKRVRISNTQYSKVLTKMIDYVTHGRQGLTTTSYFRPKKREN